MSALIPHQYTVSRARSQNLSMPWCPVCIFIKTSSCMYFGMMTRFLSEEHHWAQRSRLWSSRTALCLLDIDFCTVAIHLSQYWLTLGVFHRIFFISLIFSSLVSEKPVISWIVTLTSGISLPWIGRRDSPSAMGISFPGTYFTVKSYFCIRSSILINLGGALVRCFWWLIPEVCDLFRSLRDDRMRSGGIAQTEHDTQHCTLNVAVVAFSFGQTLARPGN